MKNIRIQKFVIEEKQTKIQFNYKETRGGITQIIQANSKIKFIPHDDLKACLDNLRIHSGLLTELIKADSVKDLEKGKELDIIENIKVVGVKITEKGETNGVEIISKRILKDGRTIEIKTPFANFDSDISEYQFTEELWSDIEDLKTEIVEYINGKFSVEGTQLSLGDLQEAA